MSVRLRYRHKKQNIDLSVIIYKTHVGLSDQFKEEIPFKDECKR